MTDVADEFMPFESDVIQAPDERADDYAPALAARMAWLGVKQRVTLTRMPSLSSTDVEQAWMPVAGQRALHNDVLVQFGHFAAFPQHAIDSVEMTSALIGHRQFHRSSNLFLYVNAFLRDQRRIGRDSIDDAPGGSFFQFIEISCIQKKFHSESCVLGHDGIFEDRQFQATSTWMVEPGVTGRRRAGVPVAIKSPGSSVIKSVTKAVE
ncbi:MAG: hypothetical protein QM757_19380 [Paludibaculum sp.]